MIIYKIKNNINGKIYIGQTKGKLTNRITIHIRDNKFPIAKALNKYGIESFTISVIDHADTKEVLNEKEIYWIKTLDCKTPKGYNVTSGGFGTVGRVWTEDQKVAQAKRMLGDSNPMSNPKTARKVAESNIGRKRSDETKIKQSVASLGKPKSEAHCENISKGLMGHEVSDEARELLRIAHTGTKQSEETIAKKRGVPQTEVANKKRSDTMANKPLTEEHKQALRKPHKMTEVGRAAIALSNKHRGHQEYLDA